MINNDASMIAGLRAALSPIPDKAPELMSPLTLAYMGDTVFDLFVRAELIERTDLTAHGLHVEAAKRVCAAAQAKAYHRIKPLLSEAEEAVFKRGRNSHLGSVPKHAEISDYRAATGLEALVGYLFFSGDDARLFELMRAALRYYEGEEE